MKTNSLAPEIDRQLSTPTLERLAVYTLAATAGVCGISASSQPAEAKVVYTPANQLVFHSLSLDLNHDGVEDVILGRNSRYGRGFSCSVVATPPSEGSQNRIFGNQVLEYPEGFSAIAADNLKAGVPIGPQHSGSQASGAKVMARAASVIGTGTGSYRAAFGQWENHGQGVTGGYLGLVLTIKGETHFGWARLNTGSFGACTARLTGYAYETVPNKAIVTGQTSGDDAIGPQSLKTQPPIAQSLGSATLGALAVGVRGLGLWKREGDDALAVPPASISSL